MSNRPTVSPQVNPKAIVEAAFAFGRTNILVSAVELDVFTHIDDGRHTAAEIAYASRSSERGMRMLLDALTAQGFLTKHSNRYELTDSSKTYLSKHSPAYMGGWTLHMTQLQPNWAKLTDAVRTGRPSRDIHGTADQGEFFSQFVHTLHAMNAAGAEAAALQTLALLPHGQEIRVLDVGAGSGVWGFAFAKLNPKARVTVADWPKVINEVTRKFAERDKLDGRVEYMEGDFREMDFGESTYDVATVGHICHGLGEADTRKLFANLRRALKPGGHIVIGEFVPDEERAHAELPLVFAINMLVHTEAGDTFTFSEYRQWLEQAGFENVSPVAFKGEPAMISANKQAAEVKKAA